MPRPSAEADIAVPRGNGIYIEKERDAEMCRASAGVP